MLCHVRELNMSQRHLMSWDISPNALGLHSFAWQVVAVAKKMARNLADQDICQERHLIKYTIYGLLPRQNVR